MSYQEKEIEKQYFSIGEVAESLQLTTSLIRYWEKEFEILRPKKNAKGDRLFTREDVENIKLIYHLVREKGYTLEGAKLQLKSHLSESQKKFRIIEKLKKLRGFLNEMKEAL